METFRSFTLKVSRNNDSLWVVEWVDGRGNPLKDFPVFYSRYSLWAQAHALTWYADELYKIKQTVTPLD